MSLRSGKIAYSENGQRTVPVERTLANLEKYFLQSDLEFQLALVDTVGEKCLRTLFHFFSPDAEQPDSHRFGKGPNLCQAVVSACMEFVERYCAAFRAEDTVVTSCYGDLGSSARDPRLFGLDRRVHFDDSRIIDWVCGSSLTTGEKIMVPANLTFCPYEPSDRDRIIAWPDSNGLASGNNIEEAILHGILEVVERDAMVIHEYNRLPMDDVLPRKVSPTLQSLLEDLARSHIECRFKNTTTDLPITTVATLLSQAHGHNPISMAYGCHLDSSIATCRALTEAIQLCSLSDGDAISTSETLDGWIASNSPPRYAAPGPRAVPFNSLPSFQTDDIKESIETCVRLLASHDVEVIVVDLGLQGIPFSTVRVLAPGLQPICRDEDRRFTSRFFKVPSRLGYHCNYSDPSEVELWPICGYK